jgi:type II secretion system protein H
MRNLRSESGFTLLELIIVVAVMGIMAAMAAPGFDSYFRRQDARTHAQLIGSTLQEARSRAVREANNYFVLFDVDATPGKMRLVDDNDNQWDIDMGETQQDFNWAFGAHPDVGVYGYATPPAATAVPEEGGGPIPDGVAPGTAMGTSFALDPTTNLPAVGFTPQGIPVALDDTANWSSGSGSYYITDNEEVVYAVTLAPLGGVRVRVHSTATADWR